MPVSLFDASPRQCRFPIEGAGLSLIVCGARVRAAGGSYCRSCRSLAYHRTLPAMTVPAKFDPRRERDTTPDLVEVFA